MARLDLEDGFVLFLKCLIKFTENWPCTHPPTTTIFGLQLTHPPATTIITLVFSENNTIVVYALIDKLVNFYKDYALPVLLWCRHIEMGIWVHMCKSSNYVHKELC